MAGSLDEILSANEQYASSFGAKGELACRWRAARDPHLHGRQARPRQVRGPEPRAMRSRRRHPDLHTPLVPARIPIYGYLYDVQTGRLNEVAAATTAGRAV